MKIFSFLADQAQIDPQSKVHALGLNWTHAGLPTPPMAVVVFAEVPPDEGQVMLHLSIELLDSQDAPLMLPQPPDGQPKEFKVETDAKADPRDPENEWPSIRVPFVAQIGPGLPIPPGDFKFRITVGRAGGETLTDELRFRIAKDSIAIRDPKGRVRESPPPPE